MEKSRVIQNLHETIEMMTEEIGRAVGRFRGTLWNVIRNPSQHVSLSRFDQLPKLLPQDKRNILRKSQVGK